MLALAVTKSDRPQCRKFPQLNNSSCGSGAAGLGCVAQGCNDRGFQTPFSNFDVAQQAIHDIHQHAFVRQLGAVDFTLDHDGAGRILHGYQALVLHTRGGQRNLIGAQCFFEQ